MAADQNTAPGVQAPVGISQEVAYLQALGSPLVPKIYANTFGIILNPPDMSILLGISGAPAGVLTLGYSTAKTLAMRLQDALKQYEEKAGIQVTALDELDVRMRTSAPS